MYVTITLIICLSVVFVITLGIVSYTLRDENFKARFDDKNRRLSRIIRDQRNELISYREAIKENNDNLEKSLKVLASASDAVNKKISRLKDTEEAISMIKMELEDFILKEDKSSAIRSLSSYIKKINDDNVRLFQHFEERLVYRPSHLSPEEKKHFMEYMQACSEGYAYINKDKIFVTLEDVKTALECVGTNNWGLLYDIIPSEEDNANEQNTERNQ